MKSLPHPAVLSRRTFLCLAAQLTAGLLVSTPLTSLAAPSKYHPLSFYHTHTGESLDIVFNLKTGLPEKQKKVHRFLRDFRTGDIHPIDPGLLDMLCRIQKQSGSSGRFEVISGFRSSTTNEKLRKKSSGVAQKSLHMEGRAIDIRLTDVKTKKLKNIACALQRGGVGYYPKSNFLHLDTGRFRTW